MKLLVLPGDHVGLEIVAEALKVLNALMEFRPDVEINTQYGLIGGASLYRHGVPITEEVLREAEASDAVLLGSVGGPEWSNIPGHLSPEQGILQLRQRLMAFANIRPWPVSCAWSYGTVSSEGGCSLRHEFCPCQGELRRSVFWRQRRATGHGLGSLGLFETGD